MSTANDPGRCERTLLLLSLRADGAATPQQLAEIDAHLPGCAGCRRAAAADAAVAERLRARAEAPAPSWLAGFAERTAQRARVAAHEARAQNRLLWMSAAAAVVVAATVQVALVRSEPAAPGAEGVVTARESARLALIRAPRLHRGERR